MDWLKEKYVVEFDMVVRVLEMLAVQAFQSSQPGMEVV